MVSSPLPSSLKSLQSQSQQPQQQQSQRQTPPAVARDFNQTTTTYLRPIPEDSCESVSDQPVGNATAAAPSTSLNIFNIKGRNNNSSNNNNDDAASIDSSTRALQAGDASVVSGAQAVLAGSRLDAHKVGLSPSVIKRQRRQRCRECCQPTVANIGLLTLVLALIVVAIVMTLKENRLNNYGGKANTAKPAVDLAVLKKYQNVLEKNAAKNNLTNFTLSSHDQQSALDWLSSEDLLRQDVLSEGSHRMIQRFALTMLSTSTSSMITVNLNSSSSNGNSTIGNDDDSRDLNSNDTATVLWRRPDQHECTWQGVECSDQDRVRYLLLDDLNWTGTIPTELGLLTELQELSLSNNYLKGTIPTEIGTSLSNLYWLDLSNNTFSGQIPGNLWVLPVLRFVYLQNNELTGNITNAPTNATFSYFLQDVWLDNNLLTGNFPKWIEQLINVKSWFCLNNQLGGTLPRRMSFSVKYFDASFNNLVGTLPETLFDSPELEVFMVDDNNLNGTLPSETYFPPMHIMWLNDNDFSGTVPDTFGQYWSSLEQLQLQGNDNLVVNITSQECSQWPNMTDLIADCGKRRDSSGASTSQSSSAQANLDSKPVQCACCTECY